MCVRTRLSQQLHNCWTVGILDSPVRNLLNCVSESLSDRGRSESLCATSFLLLVKCNEESVAGALDQLLNSAAISAPTSDFLVSASSIATLETVPVQSLAQSQIVIYVQFTSTWRRPASPVSNRVVRCIGHSFVGLVLICRTREDSE